MEKKMSIKSQMFWGKTFVGIVWIIVGICGMINTLACNIIQIVLLVIGIVSMVVLMKSKHEEDDEMSEYNYMKAKANTTRVMHYVFCIAMVASPLVYALLRDVEVSWVRVVSQLFFVLMGIQDITTGMIFRRLEAE